MAVTIEQQGTGRKPLARGARVAIAAIALGTFVVSLIVAGTLFPHQSVNNDEAVYVFQGEMLREGNVTLPAEPYRDFFRPWMSGEHDGRRVLVFQPVFPATLAASEALFGTMRVAPALIAGGCVLLIAAFTYEVLRRGRTAVAAAALFSLSPFAIIHGALYLEYLYSVLLQLATLVLLLQGRRLRSTLRLVGAGATMGLLFFMRPADALLLGVALGAYLLVDDRRDWARLGRTVGFAAAGALPFVVACFGYNAYLTGDPMRFPLWVIGGDNRFGFGPRQIVDGAPIVDVTFGKAFDAMRLNLGEFPHWFAGSVVGLALSAYGLWRLRRERSLVLLVALAVVVPVGYLFYWGNTLIVSGRHYFGPHYYLALMIPACVLAATGLTALFDQRRQVAYGLMALLVVGTAVEMPHKIRLNDRASDVARAEDALLDRTVVGDAVVIVPMSKDGSYVLHPRGWLSNPPDLHSRVLYAADRQEQNLELFDRFPQRSIYRLQQGEGSATGSRHRPTVRKLDRVRVDGEVSLDVTARNVTGDPVVLLYAALWFDQVSCVLDGESTADATYEQRVTVDAEGVTLHCPDGEHRMALPPDAASISVGVGLGADQTVDNSALFEYRFLMRSPDDDVEMITPPDQWRRDPTLAGKWSTTDGNPAIEVRMANGR